MHLFKKALVTGAAGGLGKSLSRLLAKKKIDLILTSRNEIQLKNLADELKNFVQIEYHVCDLAIKEDRQKLLRRIETCLPDLVINNAGFGLYGDVLKHPTSEHLEMVELNVMALLEISIETARYWVKNEKLGTILNVSSAASFFCFPEFATYTASKAFVNLFSQAFDAELKTQGIRILTACPGQIATGFRLRASKGFPQKKDAHTMSVDEAARCIWRQIKKGKTLNIFDAYYKCLVFFGRFFCPKKILQKILKKSLSNRYNV